MGFIRQYYGIKYPFTINNINGFFVDLNNRTEDKIASEIVHTILTPKGTRIRMPEFGTDLVKYLFEPSEEFTWENIKSEIMESISRFVPNTTLNDIEISTIDDGGGEAIYIDLRYSVIDSIGETNNRLVIKL